MNVTDDQGKIYVGLSRRKSSCRQTPLNHPKSEQIEMNLKDDQGMTAFVLACVNGWQNVVKVLLHHSKSHGIDLNVKSSLGGVSSVHLDSRRSPHLNFDASAFMLACCNEDITMVNLLLDHSEKRKIDLNRRNVAGMTGFMQACRLGQIDTVKLLLDHQAKKKH